MMENYTFRLKSAQDLFDSQLSLLGAKSILRPDVR
jgi:hypothetical protein